MPIHHFTDPEKVTVFMQHLHTGESKLKNAYKKEELENIGRDLGLTATQLKGTKEVIAKKIFQVVQKHGPGLEATLRQNVLLQYEDTTDQEPKPYHECTLKELKEEAELEQILSSGSSQDIIARLKRMDDGKGEYEDSTTDWIRNELAKNGFRQDGTRSVLFGQFFDSVQLN